ncbi:MAG TPA: hypothetical protein VEI49_00495, partial [Terriglobales bacterium]|nr:hypothetical protein [Terriglobales bacterium]
MLTAIAIALLTFLLLNGEDRKDIRERPDLRMGALGSGSDYAAYVDHLGIALRNLAYGGEDESGI